MAALYIGGERRSLTCRKSFRMENPGRLTVVYAVNQHQHHPDRRPSSSAR